jgi:hypothetical protein
MKEYILTIIIISVLFTFGFCSTRAEEIEPVRWADPTIDWESLDIAIENIEGECVYGEMPEIQFGLYFCKED